MSNKTIGNLLKEFQKESEDATFLEHLTECSYEDPEVADLACLLIVDYALKTNKLNQRYILGRLLGKASREYISSFTLLFDYPDDRLAAEFLSAYYWCFLRYYHCNGSGRETENNDALACVVPQLRNSKSTKFSIALRALSWLANYEMYNDERFAKVVRYIINGFSGIEAEGEQADMAKILFHFGTKAVNALPVLMQMHSLGDDERLVETARISIKYIQNRCRLDGINIRGKINLVNERAYPLKNQIKLFYVIFSLHKMGFGSLRSIEHVIKSSETIFNHMVNEGLPITLPSYRSNLAILDFLFNELYNSSDFRLFAGENKNGILPAGEKAIFSVDAQDAWEWCDGYLRLREPSAWFGFHLKNLIEK